MHPRPAPRPAPHPGLFSSILNIGWGVVDNFFGFSSMWGDIQTLMGNGSWQDKAKALLDLGFNIFMDASMFTGVGEEARVAELAVKEGADLGEHLLEDSAEHAAEACGLSFAATTLVASASGEVAISSLHIGDKVWAYNSSTHKMELEPVQQVWINHDNDLLDLTIQSQTKVPEAAQKDAKAETIHTTRKHPFLTVERGFLPANALKPGMHVIEANGHIGVITKWVVVAGQAMMYNLTVAYDHTYAVGVGQWVEHNCGVGDENPLKDVQYTDRVYGQRGMSAAKDEHFHNFPDIVDNYGAEGTRTQITGGDGVTRTKIQIPGWYKGKSGNAYGGVFEYIIEPDGRTVNHRVFIPNR